MMNRRKFSILALAAVVAPKAADAAYHTGGVVPLSQPPVTPVITIPNGIARVISVSEFSSLRPGEKVTIRGVTYERS